ncbi:MAG TPA: phage holin family protein [Vicinamibacterales bacterium]|nr:phage holin family protein [Vicinamibacterales bacterium]
MAVEYDERASIPSLVQGLLDDARDLIREELQLARAEIREEIARAQTAAVAFAIAAAVGLLGAALLSVAIGSAIAYFLRWPPWAGYGVTAILFLAGAWGLYLFGRSRLTAIRAIPETKDAMKETLTWMQQKSGRR